MTDCVFCRENWDNLDIVERVDNIAIIRPLNPVTDGHVLVIHAEHSKDAADDPFIAKDLMFAAAIYVMHHKYDANIITSIGRSATQSVFHTHVHVVPRRKRDGLHLPWTGQDKKHERDTDTPGDSWCTQG